MCLRTESGQATVEAAFLIPILFVVVLMLIQPGIILYDRMVMNHAASEGCRMLATSTSSADSSPDRCEELIRRRLGAIPQQDLFHIHDGGCSYQISLSGGDSASQVEVGITNQIRLLPLFDVFGTLSGIAPDGRFEIHVVQGIRTQPDWVEAAGGAQPSAWVHERD